MNWPFMLKSTHENILAQYKARHDDIINDLAYSLWAAGDDRTKAYIARVVPVTGRPTLKSLSPWLHR